MRAHLLKQYKSITSLLLLFTFLLTTTSNLKAQTFVEKLRQEDKGRNASLELREPFAKSKDQQKNRDRGIAGEKQYLDLSLQFNKEVITEENERLQIKLPLTSTKEVLINLKQVEILAPGFIFRDGSGKSLSTEDIGKYYWGYALDYPGSTVAISIFSNEISGTIDLGNQSYTLGKLENAKEHIVYQEKDLQVQAGVSCGTDDLKQGIVDNVESGTSRQNPNPNNCVNIYMEVDHDFYQVKGTLAATVNYMTSAFSQVAIFYANENVNVKLSELKVWDTVDPYNGPTDGDYLDQIQAAFSGTSFNGDLAHLVGGTGGSGGSGIAYVNVLCSSTYAFGYSVVGPTYQNVPTYSVTISVLAHELGHNMASPHTHSCSWNGNNTQIDDCGNQYIANPGSCYDANNPIIPSQGGTMMSYCHLNSVGVDFNLGMGTQPGNLVRDKVYNAACLSPCASCDLPDIPVLATPANSATNVATTAPLSWNAATGATSYDLQVGTSSGASNSLDQNFTSTSVNLSGLAENTTYYWRARSKNTCGVSAFSSEFTFTTINNSSGDFSLATNPTSGTSCNNQSIQFSVTSSATGGFSDAITLSASGLPSGATASFSTNPLTPGNTSTVTLSNFGANTGSFTIQISGVAGGITKTANYALTLNGTADVPTLSAPANGATDIAFASVSLNWGDVSGATAYFVQISTSPNGGSVIAEGQVTSSGASVSDLNPSTLYYWRVRSINACGNSSYSSDFSFTTAGAPSYSLATNPTSGTSCNNQSIQFDVTSSATGGFSDAITLSASGLPSGATASFSANPLTPGNTATVTLSNFGANTGSFTIQISGVAGGITKTANYGLTLTAEPAIATLTSPINNAVDQAINLVLDWEDVIGATSYDVQLSTSPAGVGLILDANFLISTANSPELLANTTYYWRVRSVGNCGTSTFSNDFTFVTAAAASQICSTYMSPNVPANIGLNDVVESSSILTLALDKTISDVDVVDLGGTHTWINDLEFILKGPDNTEVTLFSQICSNEDNFDINFDDGASSSTLPCPPTDGLTYQPAGNLSDFNGKNANGDWTLRLRDLAAGDDGTLNSWGLKVCYESTGVCDLNVTTTNPTGISSLMAAIDCAEPGNTVVIDLPANAIIDLGGINMLFDSNLNIISNNPVIINCSQATEPIKIINNSNVSLKNITIK